MTTTLWTLLVGGLFGLALAAPPGPMNAVIAAESVVYGWAAGFRAGLGAMTADVLFFLLALLGLVTFVERLPTVQAAMVTAGGLLMFYFAYDAARATGAAFDADSSPSQSGSGSPRGFRKALALGLTNPYQIVFWLTVGVGLLRPGELDVLAWTPTVGETLRGVLVVQTGSVELIAGLFGGIVVWIVAFPGALVTAQKRVESVAPLVAIGSAVVLAGFGLVFLWDGATTLWGVVTTGPFS